MSAVKRISIDHGVLGPQIWDSFQVELLTIIKFIVMVKGKVFKCKIDRKDVFLTMRFAQDWIREEK